MRTCKQGNCLSRTYSSYLSAGKLLLEGGTVQGVDQGLRSGLYFVRSLAEPGAVFVVYWPEETTWNDTAISSVRRNRITFMRSVPSRPRTRLYIR